MKAIYSYKIFSKTFKNKISKKAYLEAAKWLAINVYNNPEVSKNISIKIQKEEKCKIPTFEVSLFVDIRFDKIKGEYCDRCKHIYNTFYQVDKMNCDECKLNGYIKTNEKYAKGIVDFYKKIFEEKEDEEID